MHTTSRYALTLVLFLLPALSLRAADVAIPAGTLMECTLNEPSFSSATTSIGDPFLCYPRNIQEFGHPVFPRGTYIVGHLEDARDPGHFVGKGYLKMEVDRIGLPTTDIPLRAKVIAVSGYKADKHGDVLGHGHATRDIVEWSLPPLWPWKILTLPARGPRPTLKGEVRMTLRIMDDFVVPQQVAENTPPRLLLPPLQKPEKGWHSFGSPTGSPQPYSTPAARTIAAAVFDSGPYHATTLDGASRVTAQPAGVSLDSAVSAQPVLATDASALEWPKNVTVFVLADSSVIPVQEYWRDGEALVYDLTTGEESAVPLSRIDWSSTARLNWQRGIRVSLHGPAGGAAGSQ